MLPFNLSKLKSTPQFVLFKANVVYFIAIMFFSFIGISFLPQQVADYIALRQKNNELATEVAKQENRLRLIETINVQDLNQLLLILNTLYPQNEDMFSMYPVIDNLQSITGMLFVKRSSPFQTGAQNQQVISVDAIGTTEQIQKLLQDYSYKGARLLTLESVSLKPSAANPLLWEVGFAVKFHAKEIEIGKKSLDAIDPMALTFARQALQYFNSKGATYTKVSIKDEDIPLNYSTKKNPFSN